MVWLPNAREVSLTGRVRVRSGGLGRLVLQVELLVQEYRRTPTKPGVSDRAWHERMKEGIPWFEWRDATHVDIDTLGLGSKPLETRA